MRHPVAQRVGTGLGRETSSRRHEQWRSALLARALTPNDTDTDGYAGTVTRLRLTVLRRRIATLRRSDRARGVVFGILALVVAVLDVWLVIPEEAPTYSVVLSTVACAAMVIRCRWPFAALLVTIPGFLVGWSQLAAMIALGTLAKRKLWVWQTMVGAALVFLARFVLWPLDEFFALSWREWIRYAIYGVIVAGMPTAIGLLISARQELSARITQLAVSRNREYRLQEQTVRAAERARLAREMHDTVSYQVTLIAMQASALQVATQDEKTRQVATTIRELSTHTLEDLRELLGVLRSGTGENETSLGLTELPDLVRDIDVKVTVSMEALPEQLPAAVSQAAYRTVQEALTNVRKHAVGAAASVRVSTRQANLVIEVRNSRPHKQPAGLPSGGHGLQGLSERAGLLGGTFEAGSTPDGGFRVLAEYPIQRSP